MKSEETRKLELAEAVEAWLLDVPILNLTHGKARQATLDFIVNQKSLRTREHYFRILKTFLKWAEANGKVTLAGFTAGEVKSYSEALMIQKGTRQGHELSTCSQAQVVSCLRGYFKELTLCGALTSNPVLSVKAPRTHRDKGAFPALSAANVMRILESFNEHSLRDLQDRAVIGLMVYACVRVSAVTKLIQEDVREVDGRHVVALKEKGQKPHVVPLHPEAERYLRAFRERSGDGARDCDPNPDGYVFRRWSKGRMRLTSEPLNRLVCYRMVKRVAKKLGIVHGKLCNHTFRATGITTFLNAMGTLEEARRLANHASVNTTRLYDSDERAVKTSDVDRIDYAKARPRSRAI